MEWPERWEEKRELVGFQKQGEENLLMKVGRPCMSVTANPDLLWFNLLIFLTLL